MTAACARKTEAEILDEVMLAISQRGCGIWRANTGAARARSGRLVRFGMKGQTDILGVVNGRFLAIEVKTATGRLRPEQQAFREFVERHGGLWMLARSAEDAVAQLEAALAQRTPFDPVAQLDLAIRLLPRSIVAELLRRYLSALVVQRP